MFENAYNQKAGNLHLVRVEISNISASLFDSRIRDSSCTNLLCYTAGLAVLHICSSNCVQHLRLACIYMAENADDWRPQILRASTSFGLFTTFPQALPNHIHSLSCHCCNTYALKLCYYSYPVPPLPKTHPRLMKHRFPRLHCF